VPADRLPADRPLLGYRTGVRWQMVGLAFLGTTINYIDRANLGVCAPYLKSQLHLSDAQLGLVLGAFFWSYACCQIPAGWLVDRIGARLAYASAVLSWSLFTGATALVRGFADLLGLRLLLGVGESGAYPGNVKVVSEWFPKRERAFATSIFDSGARVGNAVALPIVAAIVAALGWRAAFWVTGALGVVWTVAWLRLYRQPRRHPRASVAELCYIESDREAPAAAHAGPPPHLRALFRHRTIWGMMLGFFCLSFVAYFFITWFPSYLIEARHFDLLRLGAYGAIPALTAVPGGYLGGAFSDFLVRRGASLTRARKLPIACGMLVSSLIGLAVAVPSASAALALLSLSYAGITFAAASIWSLPGDIAPHPRLVASIGGIQNFASNLGGFAISGFVGLWRARTGGSFAIPLATAGAAAVVGALSYIFLVGEIAPLPGKRAG
jgi:D-galactonate transporter